jgi:hypothetical protein
MSGTTKRQCEYATEPDACQIDLNQVVVPRQRFGKPGQQGAIDVPRRCGASIGCVWVSCVKSPSQLGQIRVVRCDLAPGSKVIDTPPCRYISFVTHYNL